MTFEGSDISKELLVMAAKVTANVQDFKVLFWRHAGSAPANSLDYFPRLTFIKPMYLCSEVTLISQSALLAGESFEIYQNRQAPTKKVTTHYKVFKHL